MGMAKISVTVDEDVLREARELAPEGNLSRLVGEALMHQVRLGRMRRWAQEQEPLPDDDPYREHVRRQWPV